MNAAALAWRAERLAAADLPCPAAEDLRFAAFLLYRREEAAAREHLERALQLALQGDDPRLLALVSDLAENIETSRRNASAALELSLAAQHFWRLTGDFDEWCTARHDFAAALYGIGRSAEAEAVLRDLLRAIEHLRPSHPMLRSTLTTLGRIAIWKGDLDGAEGLLRRASRAPEKRHSLSRVGTLSALCQLRIEQRDFQAAASLLEDMFRRVSDPLSRANLLATSGEIALGLGKPAAAVARVREARREVGRSGADPNLDLFSRFIEAKAERARGNAAAADANMEALVAGLEAYRQMSQGDLVAPFFAARREYLGEWIEDLLRRGRVADAFEVTEWTRARGLLDGLLWPPSAIRSHTDDATAHKDAEMRRELARLAASIETAPDHELERLGGEARGLRLALLALEAGSRRRAGALPAEPIGLEAAQALLEDHTLALVYWLGERRSVVWALARDRVTVSSALAPRQTLEQAALRLRRLLSQGARADAAIVQAETAALSEALLGPVAEQLAGARNLVVVPDGALAELPFAWLVQPPRSAEPGRRLIEALPVAVAHSLSVIAAVRERSQARERPQLTLVAVADPVYSPEDDRLAPLGRAATAGARTLPRLEGTRREARSAVDALPATESRLYEGFGARRDALLSGALGDSRYVQIGAHTALHWDHPELSAVYLSTFDAHGNPIDGALRLQDLDKISLSADLVVLSGCETAMGRGYLGEGPMSLPRGFLLAGATAVVASLWPVGDESTAQLIERLWHEILREHRSGAEALRRAQLSLSTADDGRSTDWSAFVLLGDWRPPNAETVLAPTNFPAAPVSTSSNR